MLRFKEYPNWLQNFHNEFSLALETLEIEREMLSDYHLKIACDYSIGNV